MRKINKYVCVVLLSFLAFSAEAQHNPNPLAYKFRTLAEALLRTADTNAIVQVAEDGIGGNFTVKRRSAKVVPDGGIVYPMADSINALVRDVSQSQSINAAWFGLVSDYDSATRTGTDNSVALQKAVNAYPNVFIPAGNYLVKHSIKIRNWKSVHISGSPLTNIYLSDDYLTGTAQNTGTLHRGVFDFFNILNVEISTLHLNMNRSHMTNISAGASYVFGIDIMYANPNHQPAPMGNYAYVHDITITNAPDEAIFTQDYKVIRDENNTMEDVNSGIGADYAETGYFINNKIVGGVGQSSSTLIGGQAIYTSNIRHFFADHNRIYDITDSGITCYSSETSSFTNNYGENIGKDGFKALFGPAGGQDTGFAQKVVMTGNTINKLWGSRVDGGAMLKVWPLRGDAIIHDNILIGGKQKTDNGGEAAISVVGVGSGINVGRRVEVSNNIMRNLESYCIQLANIKDIIIHHNIAVWDTLATTPNFLNGANVGNVEVTENEIKNYTDSLNTGGIIVSGFAAYSPYNTPDNHVKITGNTVYGFQYGISAMSFDSVAFIDISRNKVSKTKQVGIQLYTPIDTNNMYGHVTIDDNKLENVNFDASGGGGAIRLLHLQRGHINNLSIRNNTAVKANGKDLPVISLENTGAGGMIDLLELSGNNGSGFTAAPVSVNAPYTRALGLPMTAPPTAGTWVKGDVVINSNPSPQTPNSWVCTTAGSPGVWQATGLGGEFFTGSGSPEGVVYAPNGAFYARKDATSSTVLAYMKGTDVSLNTGWTSLIMNTTGIVPVTQGGTGFNGFTDRQVFAYDAVNSKFFSSGITYSTSNYVGIGTSSPAAKLTNSSTAPLFLGTGSGGGTGFVWVNNTAGYTAAIQNTRSNVQSSNGLLIMGADTSAGTFPLMVTANSSTIALVVNGKGSTGIGNVVPDSTAVLDIASANKGVMIPRLSAANRATIAGAANGLLTMDFTNRKMVQYNSTTAKWNYYIREGVGGINKDSLATITAPTTHFVLGMDSTGGAMVKLPLSDFAAPSSQRQIYVNVMDYGADSTGATDASTAFTNAIAAASTSGRVVYVPSGTYLVTNVALNNNTNILGQGNTSILKPSSGGSNKSVFTVSGVNDWSIESITFKGYNTHVSSFADSAITNSNVNGITMNIPLTLRWKISKCTFIGFNGYGLYGANNNLTVANASITGNVTNSYFMNNYCGSYFGEQVEYVNNVGNWYEGNNYGVWNLGGNNKYTSNSFKSNYVGFILDSAANSGHGSLIANDFNHCNIGLLTQSFLYGEDITGNSIFNCSIVVNGGVGLNMLGNNISIPAGSNVMTFSNVTGNFNNNNVTIGITPVVTSSPNLNEFNNHTNLGAPFHLIPNSILDIAGGVTMTPATGQFVTMNSKVFVAPPANANGMVITQNGTAAGLNVTGTTNPFLTVTSGAHTALLQNTGSLALVGTSTAIPFYLYSSNTARMRFNTDGTINMFAVPTGDATQDVLTYTTGSVVNRIASTNFLNANHPASTGSAPTISANGTNVTASITGHDAAFQLTVVVASGGASGTVCVIAFNSAWALTPNVTFSPATTSTAGAPLAANATSASSITVSTTSLAAGTYTFNFHCIQ